jgi:hypothetical protein
MGLNVELDSAAGFLTAGPALFDRVRPAGIVGVVGYCEFLHRNVG